MIAPFVALLGLFASLASTSTPAEWRQISSIYQIITDRFARTDNSTTAPCDLAAEDYCGGTWQGIINQLDYVQGMGFDAVRSHQLPHLFKNKPINVHVRFGYLLSLTTRLKGIMDTGPKIYTRRTQILELLMT